MRHIFLITTAVLLGQTSPVPAQAIGDPVVTVDSWYRAYLGRAALKDPASAGWVSLLRQGNPPAAVLSGILASDEYFNRVGGTMPAFIQAVYRQVVGRPPTPGQYSFWLQRGYTQSRQQIAYEILAQNPGAGIIVAPPAVGIPDFPRERWPLHDYRRPFYPYRW
jgi:hypothetical protein